MKAERKMNRRQLRRRDRMATGQGTTMPGSENRHKSAPAANGRRTRSRVKADSREATR